MTTGGQTVRQLLHHHCLCEDYIAKIRTLISTYKINTSAHTRLGTIDPWAYRKLAELHPHLGGRN